MFGIPFSNRQNMNLTEFFLKILSQDTLQMNIKQTLKWSYNFHQSYN